MFTSDSQYSVDLSYFVYKEFSKLIVGDWARINLWNFLLFFVLPFLDFSSYLCFNICMKSWIWFIPEDLEDLHPGNYVHNQIILRNTLTTDQILQKNWKKLASSSTKKGAINKAWMRLSRRAGALFYKKSKLTRCINKRGGKSCGTSSSNLKKLLTSKIPWPRNCPVQQINCAATATWIVWMPKAMIVNNQK